MPPRKPLSKPRRIIRASGSPESASPVSASISGPSTEDHSSHESSDDGKNKVYLGATNADGSLFVNAVAPTETTDQQTTSGLTFGNPARVSEGFEATFASVARQSKRDRTNPRTLRSLDKAPVSRLSSVAKRNRTSKSSAISSNGKTVAVSESLSMDTHTFPKSRVSRPRKHSSKLISFSSKPDPDGANRISESIAQDSGVEVVKTALASKDNRSRSTTSPTPAPRRSTRNKPAAKAESVVEEKAVPKKTVSVVHTPLQRAGSKRKISATDEDIEASQITPAKKSKKTATSKAAQKTPVILKHDIKGKIAAAEEDDEDDDEDESSVSSEDDDGDGSPSSKSKPVAKKSKKNTAKKPKPALVAPPRGLPLQAPANTLGIPKGALPLSGHYVKNQKSPLGIQLPIDAARTQWEWMPYSSGIIPLEQFDWRNAAHIRHANRIIRQQQIRRRLERHGYKKPGPRNWN